MIDVIPPNRQATKMKDYVRQRLCRHKQGQLEKPIATTTRKMMMVARIKVFVVVISSILFTYHSNYDFDFPIQLSPSPSSSLFLAVLLHSSRYSTSNHPSSFVRIILALSAFTSMATTMAASSSYHNDYCGNDENCNDSNNDNNDSENDTSQCDNNNDYEFIDVLMNRKHQRKSQIAQQELRNNDNNDHSSKIQIRSVPNKVTDNNANQCYESNDIHRNCNCIVEDESIEWLEEKIERFTAERKKQSNDDWDNN